jgi:hypothetical protein
MLTCDLRWEKSRSMSDVVTDESEALVKPETAILQSIALPNPQMRLALKLWEL